MTNSNMISIPLFSSPRLSSASREDRSAIPGARSGRPLAVLAAWLLIGGCGSSAKTTSSPAGSSDSVADSSVVVKPIPEGMAAITPVIVVSDVDKALDFYTKAFAATVKMTLPGPDGKTMHGELQIGDSVIMVSPEDPARGVKSPTTLGGTNGSLLIYVEDVDAAAQRATSAGATQAMPAADMFWGDRYAGIVDPFGHQWGLATHKEDVGSEEMTKRANDWVAKAMKGETYTPPPVTTPAASWKPEGYKTVTVTLLLSGGVDGLGFYKDTLGAVTQDLMPMPDGRLMHASMKLSGNVFHLSSEFPQMAPTHKAAANLGGCPVAIHYYVDDVDATFKAAVEGGATGALPVTDMFWGDRWGLIKDPSGNEWGVATHKQELTREQILENMKKQFGSQK